MEKRARGFRDWGKEVGYNELAQANFFCGMGPVLYSTIGADIQIVHLSKHLEPYTTQIEF